MVRAQRWFPSLPCLHRRLGNDRSTFALFSLCAGKYHKGRVVTNCFVIFCGVRNACSACTHAQRVGDTNAPASVFDWKPSPALLLAASTQEQSAPLPASFEGRARPATPCANDQVSLADKIGTLLSTAAVDYRSYWRDRRHSSGDSRDPVPW